MNTIGCPLLLYLGRNGERSKIKAGIAHDA